MNKTAELGVETLGKGLGAIAGGLFLLTVRDPATEGATVRLISWVQQAAFQPPAITIAAAKSGSVRQLIEDNQGVFAIAVIASGDSAALKKYARGSKPGEDLFAGEQTMITPAGQQVPANSSAWLDCKLAKVFDTGTDHDLLLAAVTAGEAAKDRPPMTHVRSNGFHY